MGFHAFTKRAAAPFEIYPDPITKPGMGIVPASAGDAPSKSSGSFSLSTLLIFIFSLLLAVLVGAAISFFITKNAFQQHDTRIMVDNSQQTDFNPSKGDSNEPGHGQTGQREEMEKEDTSPTTEEMRLPLNVLPVSYDLKVKTYLPGYVDFPKMKNFVIDGKVTIKMNVVKSSRKIMINSQNITIDEKKTSVHVDGKAVPLKIMMLEKYQKASFDLEHAIEPGQEVVLKIAYKAMINSELAGMYQSKYTDSKNNKKIIAVTQMEPESARLFVPCFDEPHFRANWTVTVSHPKGTQAISNGIEVGEPEVDASDSSFLVTKFVPTPSMSSYLLAVMVSEFEYIEGETKTGIRFRIWSRPEAKESTQYALKAGVRCIEFFEKYFDTPFPLKKQDMVALPDFGAGAMENWGLITYRETALLYDDKLYSMAAKRRVATVIAHELAHQWFGNLVTMEWWDNLWLNEGFANLIEFLGMDEISDGHFKAKDFFVIDAQMTALENDERASAHPLTFQIDHNTEIREGFSAITYDKGGSVLSMIRATMGIDHFNKGLHHYLKKFAYKNTVPTDLFGCFDDVLPSDVLGPNGKKLNVTEFGLQWTTQMGYPYVTLEKFNETSVKISQKRYKVNQEAKEKEKYAHPKYGFKWDVPVWYRAGDEKVKMVWLHRDEDLYLPVATEAIVMNADSPALFRTNYDKKYWKLLIENLNKDHSIYSNRTRARIVSDAFAMATIGEIDYDMIFDLIEYFKKETDYLPWTALTSGYLDILKYLGNEPESEMGEKYFKMLMHDQYKHTSVDKITAEHHDETRTYENMQEVRVLTTTCRMKDAGCNKQLMEQFHTKVVETCTGADDVASKCSTVAAPLRQSVYCTGVKNGDSDTFQLVLDLYKREPVQLESRTLLEALACSRDPTILKRLLTISMDRSANVIRFQDVNTVFARVSANPVGKEFLFGWCLQHWNKIYESFNSDHTILGRAIGDCASNIRNKDEIKQLDHFIKTAPHAGELNVLKSRKESAEVTVKWIDENFDKITKILKDKTDGKTLD